MLVLVAEDDLFIGLDIADALRQAGHQVLGPAPTIADALRRVAQTRPDLALLDIHLDGDDGAALARILRRDYGIPSLFVSSDVMRARAARDHALGCLRKPFTPQSLTACIDIAGQIAAKETLRTLPDGLELFGSHVPVTQC